MNYVIFLIFSGILGVSFIFAKERPKCAVQHNVRRAELRKNPNHPSEKILCFLKCDYERIGAFNHNKTVNADKAVEHLSSWRPLKESTRNEIRECVWQQTTEVNSCYDVEPYYQCVRQAVQNEDSSTN